LTALRPRLATSTPIGSPVGLYRSTDFRIGLPERF
jgi:hypothetical protein